MNVLCYVQPQRGGGVARHSVEMLNGLARLPQTSCTLFGSGPDLRRHPSFLHQCATLPVLEHGLPGKWMERAWKLVGWPPLASWCGGFDLIYSPAEVRLPRCGIPSIVTVHDVQALEEDLPWSNSASHRAFGRKWRRWLPWLLEEATAIATVSEFTKQRMVSLLDVDPSRICVVGNGVSQPFFRPPASAAARPHPSIVVIGGLRLKKGAAATLAVAAELERRGSPLSIDVYGHHDAEWLEPASRARNVRLHGYLDDEQLAARLSDSTALLFLSPYEGFGIPAVEAMAAGTPAVVAKAASLPEVAGDAGLVVDSSNTTEIADHLDRLNTDSEFRSTLVARGRQRATHFTWAACVDRLVAAMHQAVSSHRG